MWIALPAFQTLSVSPAPVPGQAHRRPLSNDEHYGRGEPAKAKRLHAYICRSLVATRHTSSATASSTFLTLYTAYCCLFFWQIKQKAKATMQGPNGALVPGPGGTHFSAQNNQTLDTELGNSNMGRGFDQPRLGLAQANQAQNVDNTSGTRGVRSRSQRLSIWCHSLCLAAFCVIA